METTDYIDPHIVTHIANMVGRRAAGRLPPGLLELGLFGGLDLDGCRHDDYEREVTYMYMPEHNGYRPIHQTIHFAADNIFTPSYPKPLTQRTPHRELPRPQYTPPQEPVSPQLDRPDKKIKSKATKKRIKKRRQKEKKRLEKLKREQQKPKKNTEEKEEGADAKNIDKVDEARTDGQSSLDSDSDSSSDRSEDDSDPESEAEELDMTSSFVNTAALIVKRKLEQKEPKTKPERKEEKKAPVKPEAEPTKDKPAARELPTCPTTTITPTPTTTPAPSKDISAAPINYKPIHEDNVKISTELAMLGNQHASAGRFDMAVKYFTAAIKYNPKEFKLFGNRSFCFERMQQYEKALTDAQLSLNMAPGWDKGLYRKGRALVGLRQYEEAASTFTEVLKLDSSCTEAAQELMRVQITRLMECGFTREQSSNALIIHGSLSKAMEVLTQLTPSNAGEQCTLSPGTPPVVDSSTASSFGTIYKVPVLPPAVGENPPRAVPIPSEPRASLPSAFQQEPAPPPPSRKPLTPNTHNVLPKAGPKPNLPAKTQPVPPPSAVELFPIWVGNVLPTTTAIMLTDLFSSVGKIHSVKLLQFKRCAFVNFTTQEHCDQAIRQFHGYELLGTKLALRYPDRIPQGMGMSRTALKAENLPGDSFRHRENGQWRK